MIDRTCPPPIHPIGNLELPKPISQKLGNGVSLHVLDSGTQELNQLFLVWPGGVVEARTAAVASLAGSLLREGVEGMTGAELSEALDFRGAIYRNEVTDHFSVLAIASVNNLADGVYDLLAKMVEKPIYNEHALEIYREKAIKTKLINDNKVSVLSLEALLPMIYGKNNPLARVQTVEDIQSVNRDDLVKFHHDVYTACGCHAFLSGRITDKIHAEVGEMLSNLPSSVESMTLAPCPIKAESPEKVFVEKSEVLQNSIRMALPAPRRDDPDYLPLRFTITALGGYFGSRLMKNIREDKGYTYGINAYLLGGIDGSYISISTQADPHYVDDIIEETKKEMIRLAESPLDSLELDRVKQYISMSLIDTLDSPLSIMDYYKTMLVAGLPNDYFAKQVELVHSISPNQIMEMAHKYLNPNQLRIVVAGI